MRAYLLLALLCIAVVGRAQTPVPVPAKAIARLEQLVRKTQAVVVIGNTSGNLPVEARPKLNRVLVDASAEFLRQASHNPTREGYFKTLDASLARLNALATEVEDRQQLAEYFQDVLDIVGLESSDGRLTAFVENTPPQR
ncbi:DUF4844 domain-containing protein [Hymenobacter sp. DH14]|uniref:DUF4844 domain-containing protein n=1 Tax=Hymenobacter cyanobacteriorum TaxID=2926463 RepID=A0A9X1VG56_9BACT|nr:DUF4844 domain-containing protein [Hymenobacter cyanobacteriorum]MCI1188599.1 DUF4844 domain-containing protein [Hymenobacter cyanobacteriorum]